MIKDLLRAFLSGAARSSSRRTRSRSREALCDRIAILAGGRIRALGTMEELRERREAGAAGLEEIFLKLTGGERSRSWSRRSRDDAELDESRQR